MRKLKVTEIHIEGRLWFQTTYGNTYNTTKTLVVFKDGSTKEFYTPMEYGYGSHYKTIAIENLVKLGILPEADGGRTWYHGDFREAKIKVFNSHSDVLKRDLHKCEVA